MIAKKEVHVIAPKDVFIGDLNAPVTLMEFADYETEAASAAHEVVKQILDHYNGQVKFVFRHFPLVKVHQRAHKAAEAAIAAAQEGKFWEMHELLLKNRRNLGTISLKSHAKNAGVAGKGFLDSLIESKFGWYVQDDLKEGVNMGVREIPAFFINGDLVEGPITFRHLKTKIDLALNTSKRKAA